MFEDLEWIDELLDRPQERLEPELRRGEPKPLPAPSRLGDPGPARFPLDRDGLEARVRSVSYIAAMDPGERDELVALGMSAVDGMDEPFVLPYNTLVYWCSRLS